MKDFGSFFPLNFLLHAGKKLICASYVCLLCYFGHSNSFFQIINYSRLLFGKPCVWYLPLSPVAEASYRHFKIPQNFSCTGHFFQNTVLLASSNPSGMQLYVNGSAYTDIPYSGLRGKINSPFVKFNVLHQI